MALPMLFDVVRSKYAFFASISLKKDQEVVLQKLVEGVNCVVQLPTGFGKSMLFALTPLLLDVVSINVTDDQSINTCAPGVARAGIV